MVEDVPQVRAVTGQVLWATGYEVEVISRPGEALERPRGGPAGPQLLLTVVVTPGLEGRARAEEMLRRYPGLRVR